MTSATRARPPLSPWRARKHKSGQLTDVEKTSTTNGSHYVIAQGLERHHKSPAGPTQPATQPVVLALDAAGHHRPAHHPGRLGRIGQPGGDPQLGFKPRIGAALGKYDAAVYGQAGNG